MLTCLGLTVYFAHHTYSGRHGFEARSRLVERISLLEFELKSLETARSKLQRDVALLGPELPHADLVEEIARDVLGFAHPADRIVSQRP
ncbi:MAG: hypothetical protein CTY20_04215 [Hyphomicrobium sp.]|nr:MAG: hypothetical protein CTY20_04215 [Hyphomicrobium sp.]